MKKISSVISSLFFVSLVFLGFNSCDSFMNNNEVKNEILNAIDYNNAKNIPVLIQAKSGEGNTVPAGYYSAKQGYEFEISFSEAPGYSFEKWGAYTSDDKATPVTDGVFFENPTSTKTKVIIKNDSVQIKIVPVCNPRISTTNELPKYESQGVSRDTSINVTFTQKLNPKSFIFSEDEIPQGAQVKKDSTGKIWAYTFDDQTYFKNISITNAEGISIAQYFTQPQIDETTGKVLTIAADESNRIPFNETETLKTINVTLSANIENENSVSMSTDKSWKYQINESTVQKVKIKDTSIEGQGSLENKPNENEEFSIGQKVALSFNVKEGFKFERWVASSEKLPTGEDISDYVIFVDETNPNTIIIFIKPLDGLEIKAVANPLPSFDFKLTGSNGKFSPAKGLQPCTETYTYPISFEPDSDYEFLRWEIYDTRDGKLIENNTYIKIADMKNQETTYSFVTEPPAAPNSDPNVNTNTEPYIAIRPVIAERPQIISYSPLYDAAGVNIDTTIRVIFDYDMDESSIYYTQKEIDEMKANGDADEGACQEGNIYYGYKKNGQLFYKNIILKNNDGGSNVNENYNHPVFENPRALTISANRQNLLPAYTQVLVTLNKNISYKEDDVNVAMATSKKWIFQLKNDSDNENPTLATGDISVDKTASAEKILTSITPTDTEQNPWTPWSDTDVKYNNSKNLHIQLSTSDAGSGISDYFTLITKRVYDENYDSVSSEEVKKLCYYQNINQTTKEAVFNKTLDLSDYADGVYTAYLEIKDITGNTLTYPESGYYYFAIDETKPELKSNPVIEIDTTTDNQLNLSWNVTKDCKTTIEYQKENENTWTTLPETTESRASIPNLETGKNYNIRFSLKDYNNNSFTPKIYSRLFEFGTVSNIKVDSYTNDTITLSWDAPDDTNCTGYEITMSQWISSGPEYITQTFNITGKDKTTITLPIPERQKIDSNSTKSVFYTANLLGYLKSLNFTIKAKYDTKKSKEITYNTYSGFLPRVVDSSSSSSPKYTLTISVNYWKINNFDNFTHKLTLYYKDNPNDTYTEYLSTTNYYDYIETGNFVKDKNKYFKLTWTFTNPQTNETVTRDSVLFKWDKNRKELIPYIE